MNFIDINLGWTNYIQLYNKEVPEFKNNIILLDGDIPSKKDYIKWRKTVESSNNIMILPIVVEKGLFSWLKNVDAFSKFVEYYTTDGWKTPETVLFC